MEGGVLLLRPLVYFYSGVDNWGYSVFNDNMVYNMDNNFIRQNVAQFDLFTVASSFNRNKILETAKRYFLLAQISKYDCGICGP